jgi:predicted RNA-binding Zn ribbon-like protein
VDALRQSLREVVQALARVRHSQAAARAALSAAIARAASDSAPPQQEVQQMAQDFASTASSPDYDSLIAITSALVGVNRERVQALLGLR